MNAKSGQTTHLGVGERLTKRNEIASQEQAGWQEVSEGASTELSDRQSRVARPGEPGARRGATAPWISRPRWWVAILFSPFPLAALRSRWTVSGERELGLIANQSSPAEVIPLNHTSVEKRTLSMPCSDCLSPSEFARTLSVLTDERTQRS